MTVQCEYKALEEENGRLSKSEENEEIKKTLQWKGRWGKNSRCKKGDLSNTDLLNLQQIQNRQAFAAPVFQILT